MSRTIYFMIYTLIREEQPNGQWKCYAKEDPNLIGYGDNEAEAIGNFARLVIVSKNNLILTGDENV